MNSTSARLQALTAPALTLGAGFLLGLWAYWPTLVKVAEKWSTDAQYSHGRLVPLFAIALLALRRQQLEEVTWQVNPWGLLIVLAGCAVRLVAARFYLEWLDGY